MKPVAAAQAPSKADLAEEKASNLRMLAQSKPGGRAPSPYFAKVAADRLRTIAQHERLHALRAQKSKPAPSRRAAGRAPRRPRSAPRRPATRVDSDDGPPAPPGGPLVHQGNSGLPRRVYLALVRDRGVRFAKVGRLVVCRLDDLQRALGLGDAAPAPEAPAWSPETVLRAIRGGK